MEREYELYHHGVKGMKWGVRKKYYNSDGSPNALGRSRQTMRDSKSAYRTAKKAYNKSFNKASNYSSNHAISQFVGKKAKTKSDALWEDAYDKGKQANKAQDKYKQAKKDYKNTKKAEKEAMNPNRKREIAIAVGSAAGTALAAYGVYKVSQAIKSSKFKRSMKDGLKYLESMESKGRFDVGMEELRASMNDWYGASTSKVIKNMIDNNTRTNGSVDLKGVIETYKKGAKINL